MKKTIIYIIIAIIVIALLVFLGIYLTKDKEERIKDVTQNFNIDFSEEDIKLLEISILTEGGREEYTVTDKEVISKIYDAILNIKIFSKSNIRTSDDSIFYTFKLNNNTKKTIGFEGKNIIIGEEQYQIDGYSKLRNIDFKN